MEHCRQFLPGGIYEKFNLKDFVILDFRATDTHGKQCSDYSSPDYIYLAIAHRLQKHIPVILHDKFISIQILDTNLREHVLCNRFQVTTIHGHQELTSQK